MLAASHALSFYAALDVAAALVLLLSTTVSNVVASIFASSGVSDADAAAEVFTIVVTPLYGVGFLAVAGVAELCLSWSTYAYLRTALAVP